MGQCAVLVQAGVLGIAASRSSKIGDAGAFAACNCPAVRGSISWTVMSSWRAERHEVVSRSSVGDALPGHVTIAASAAAPPTHGSRPGAVARNAAYRLLMQRQSMMSRLSVKPILSRLPDHAKGFAAACGSGVWPCQRRGAYAKGCCNDRRHAANSVAPRASCCLASAARIGLSA